jgi:hypothetical protein
MHGKETQCLSSDSRSRASHPSSERLRSATPDWAVIFLLFSSFAYFSSLQRRTDFRLVLVDFDLFRVDGTTASYFWPKMSYQKDLDGTELAIDSADWVRKSDKVRQEPSGGTTN